MCLLRRTLYGHPDSGTFWEHCNDMLTNGGMMAGPGSALDSAWHMLQRDLNIDTLAPTALDLGSKREVAEAVTLGGKLVITMT